MLLHFLVKLLSGLVLPPVPLAYFHIRGCTFISIECSATCVVHVDVWFISSENTERCPSYVSKPKVTSVNSLFCATDGPKHKDITFTMRSNRKSAHLRGLEPEHLSLINDYD